VSRKGAKEVSLEADGMLSWLMIVDIINNVGSGSYTGRVWPGRTLSLYEIETSFIYRGGRNQVGIVDALGHVLQRAEALEQPHGHAGGNPKFISAGCGRNFGQHSGPAVTESPAKLPRPPLGPIQGLRALIGKTLGREVTCNPCPGGSTSG
jgi:hypothetical protein